MLVGTRNLSHDEIKEATTVESLRRLATEQVPLLFRHIKEIVDNQKYLVALEVRKIYKGDYNKWHGLCEGLLEGVKVTGSIHTIYTCYELLNKCDFDMIEKFLEKDESDDNW